VAVSGIPFFGRLAAILARLEFAGLFHLMRFAGYVPLKTGCPTSVHHHGMRPASSRQYISAKHAAHSAAAKKPPLRKMKFELNRWLANSSTHMKSTFQA
jgi:hypothetical protein